MELHITVCKQISPQQVMQNCIKFNYIKNKDRDPYQIKGVMRAIGIIQQRCENNWLIQNTHGKY